MSSYLLVGSRFYDFVKNNQSHSHYGGHFVPLWRMDHSDEIVMTSTRSCICLVTGIFLAVNYSVNLSIATAFESSRECLGIQSCEVSCLSMGNCRCLG